MSQLQQQYKLLPEGEQDALYPQQDEDLMAEFTEAIIKRVVLVRISVFEFYSFKSLSRGKEVMSLLHFPKLCTVAHRKPGARKSAHSWQAGHSNLHFTKERLRKETHIFSFKLTAALLPANLGQMDDEGSDITEQARGVQSILRIMPYTGIRFATVFGAAFCACKMEASTQMCHSIYVTP